MRDVLTVLVGTLFACFSITLMGVTYGHIRQDADAAELPAARFELYIQTKSKGSFTLQCRNLGERVLCIE